VARLVVSTKLFTPATFSLTLAYSWDRECSCKPSGHIMTPFLIRSQEITTSTWKSGLTKNKDVSRKESGLTMMGLPSYNDQHDTVNDHIYILYSAIYKIVKNVKLGNFFFFFYANDISRRNFSEMIWLEMNQTYYKLQKNFNNSNFFTQFLFSNNSLCIISKIIYKIN